MRHLYVSHHNIITQACNKFKKTYLGYHGNLCILLFLSHCISHFFILFPQNHILLHACPRHLCPPTLSKYIRDMHY